MRVGSIIKLMRDQFTPSDICVIYSPEKENSLYVETKNLDGETNLKHRRAPKELHQNENLYENFEGVVNSELPNAQIDKFSGNIELRNGGTIPIGPENIMLRGCSLRNTAYVHGIVIFTGHDTKIFQNSMKPEYKFSRLEKLTNKAIVLVFILQIVAAIVAASFGFAWI